MRIIAFAALILGWEAVLWGQNKPDLATLHQIKVEAFQNSKVMDILANLTDLYGPRLTASPEWNQAAEWTMGEMKNWGLSNVHEETYPFGYSWSVESYSVDMLTPRYSHLVAAPLAWSAPTDGVKTADLLYAPFTPEHWYEFKKWQDELERYRKEWHGKLKGKIVLVSDSRLPKASTTALFERYTDAQLSDIAKAPDPSIRRDNITLDQVVLPKDADERRKYFDTLPNPIQDQLFDRYNDLKADLGAFYKEEGVLAVLSADERSHNGAVHAEAAGSFTSKKPLAPASFVVTEEQYSRMQRLVEKKQVITVRLELKAKVSKGDVDAANIIAEIPGRKKPDEIVMVGAHFDSWHTGTGATDNGAGSAVMLEAMRVLNSLKLPMDRTVRIGLWSGEEQGLYGSRAYVKAHLADIKTRAVKPDQAKFDVYLNLDNGSGKIRGVYLEENDAIRPIFEELLAPFRDLGVTTVSAQHTFGTDHLSFQDAGLPAFQFIQDPLDYESLVHHSDVDTYSHAVPEDLMQASAVIATLVYDFANRDDLAPRKSFVRDGKVVNP